MKKLVITLLMLAAIPMAFAQGSFNANNLSGAGNVFSDLGQTSLAGSDYSVQVFWGTIGTAEASLVAFGPVTALYGTTGGVLGTGAGWFDVGTLDLFSGQASGPASVLVQYRGTGPLGAVGRSAIVTQPIGFTPNFPGDPTDTGAWSIVIVPEPSTIALAGLGAVALLAIRRRK